MAYIRVRTAADNPAICQVGALRAERERRPHVDAEENECGNIENHYAPGPRIRICGITSIRPDDGAHRHVKRRVARECDRPPEKRRVYRADDVTEAGMIYDV